jgi:3'-phosphoadenosine 5'-phosphosulfate (PAPS) 3'-phosphatase
MMAYVGSATHKWDSCAGEAVVKSLGGCFTTPSGKSINYDPKL